MKRFLGKRPSDRVCGISTRTIHKSPNPSLSQTIWPRWASRQFLSLPIVRTLLPVTWLFPKHRGCRYETIKDMKVDMTKLTKTLTQEDFHGACRSCWNGTTSVLQPEEITSSFICVLPIKVHIPKKSGTLFNDPRINHYSMSKRKIKIFWNTIQ